MSTIKKNMQINKEIKTSSNLNSIIWETLCDKFTYKYIYTAMKSYIFNSYL